ncbi:YcxB family protein [Candidatus Enterococcus mansonii]|uniref:YcxB-like protein domain-containing protein n=1 Tax=Candidatus Enterococcus mansonii TaxID=1834181 RepID=A0A242CDP8_9ENTE|nr:YcxB family protein [Enterococcus sp. 4G2_DIV0659]OTO07902.1 hypothetical protein A5880_002172 [Enterococcus sp. 4G2_DIV0659]
MNITFSQAITKENWTNFNKKYYNYKFKKRKRLLFTLGVLSVLFLLFSLFNIWRIFQQPVNMFFEINLHNLLLYCPIYFWASMIFLLLAIEFFVLYRFQLDFMMKRFLRNPKNASIFIDRHYTITDETIEITSEFTSSVYAWPSFIEVVETDVAIGLFINSSTVLLILKQNLMSYQLEQLQSAIYKHLSAHYIYLD